MSTAKAVLAAVLALVGLVWVGQGLGFIGGSPMTNDMKWAIAGVALLVVAGVIVWAGRRR